MKLEKILKEDRRVKQLTYEYILPDYEGTLKRVMMTDATVMPAGTSRLGDDVVLSGAVSFSMLYLTVEDTLATLHFEVPYECSFVVSGDSERQLDRILLTSFSCLPSGPRRLIAKAEVVATLCEISTYDAPTLREEEGLMTLCETHEYHTHCYSKKEEREYAEEILSTEGEEPIVLYHDTHIELSQSRVMKDGVTVSGALRIRCLLGAREGGARSVSGEIPFEEFIPMGESLSEKASISPTVSLVASTVSVEREEGVYHLIANPTLSFFVCATKENRASVVVDAYSTECETKLAFENLSLTKELPVIHHRQKLECRLPKNEGDPLPLHTVLFAKSEGALVECTPDDGVVYLLLKLSHSIAGTDASFTVEDGQDDEREEGLPLTYVRQRAESTHALNIPSTSSTRDSAYRISSLLVSSPEIYEEEDAFLLVCEVSFALTLYHERTVSVVVGCEKNDESFDRVKDAYVITYPQKGATLWSLGKANYVSISDILALNTDLSTTEECWNTEDSLCGVKYILLP